MNVTLIAAMTKNKVIGFNNRIPWKVPDEMRHFKETTRGNIVIMGNTTFYSIGTLKNRINIVLTRNTMVSKDNDDKSPVFLNSVEDCFSYIEGARKNDYTFADIYVIGGEQIYRLFEPYATDIILSEIPTELEGDTFFPIDIDDISTWELHYVEYRGTYTLRKYLKINS